MRLIDADKLLKDLKKTDRYFALKFDIEDAPTVERPRGEWEKKSVSYDYFYCSKCGYAYETAGNFCPNCGADMRKEGEAE